jgi:small-conductance mechanosensitive channel
MEVEQAMNAPKNAPSIGSVIIWAFVMTFLMLGPAWVLWLCGRFPEYTFSEVKIGSPLGNEQMEFIRISVFVYAAYMSFLLVEWLVSSLPARLLQLMKWLHHAPSVSTQRSIVYFVSARSYFTFAIWLVVLGVTGASLLYRTNFINAVGGSLLSKTSVKPAAEAVAEIKPVQNEWFYAECLVLVMAIFSVFYALANYLVELVKVNFHRMAYEERINTLNVNFQVITKLHSALRHPGKKIKIERGVEAYLIRDRLSELVSEKRASDLAANLYEKLVPTNRDYLTIDDFANYFEPTDLEESFRVFDKAGHGDLDRTEIRDAVLDVYQQRKAVAKGILNNNNIIRKLGGIMLAVAVFFTITFSVPIFNIGGAAIFAIYGLLWTAFGFLFQSTAKSCFESMIFVFVEHAYDVGDRVVVDDEFLTVETVEIFTTIFRRWDGTAVYIPNSVLSGKNIYNIRPSQTQLKFP